MDERDDWLEGVRRWYFGGEAPAEALAEPHVWPEAKRSHCADCSQHAVKLQRPLPSAGAPQAA